MTTPGWNVPIGVLADSYKAGHYAMYPEATKMVAYGEFRRGFEGDKKDTRFVYYGIRHIVENYIAKKWTEKDVEDAARFYQTHNVGSSPYPFPKDLFLKFVRENDGYFPIKLESLLDGTVANAHVPVYQITAQGEYSHLITFFETILTHVWYGSSVATLSRRCKDVIEKAFDTSVEDKARGLLEFKLHDFGMRGCTTVEQTIVGGLAHLLNFCGSDTMPACYVGQFSLNEGKPIAWSIPATEHSIMTSWPSEADAIRNMIQKFGGPGRVFACVMDSYNYSNALTKVLPMVAEEKEKKGGVMVLRPDSGDPVKVVLEGIKAGERVFGADTNAKGYKVLRGVNVIQGDGINHVTLAEILEAVLAGGYSAENVSFGMGGGLLQKVNRDTMSFATKLSYLKDGNGEERDIMKKPQTDATKISLPGVLGVKVVNGVPTVFPAHLVTPEENLLKVVYDCRPVPGVFVETFDQTRERVTKGWKACPPNYDPISSALREKISSWTDDFEKRFARMYSTSTN